MMAEIRLVFDHALRVTRVNTTQGQVLRPMMQIRLSYNSSSIDLDAMVDTGADFSTFYSGIAASLDIPECEMIPDALIAQKQGVQAWFCPIVIDVLGRRFDCRACFIDNPEWPPVIGRDTVFSRFKFGFRQSVGQFYISSSP